MCYNYSLNTSGPETLQTLRSTANTHRRVIPVSGLKCTPIVFSPQDIDRFWSKVDQSAGPDGCHPWTAAKFGSGYGKFRANGRDYGSHRVAYELVFGEIPESLPDSPAARVLVCHKCDNQLCCNPACLFLGTDADNAADRNAKGRQARGDRHGSRTHPERLAAGDRNGARTHPDRVPRGDRHGSRTHPERTLRGERVRSAKTTEETVRAILARFARGGVTRRELAREFGLPYTRVKDIVGRRAWKHLQEVQP